MKGVAVVLLSVACWGASLGALNRWQALESDKEYMSIPPVTTARAMCAGFDNLAADAFFINFIVYFGKHLHRDKAYFNLKPTLELVTDLDPKFGGAYLMGAMALGDNGQVDDSEALWNKGLAANPTDFNMTYNAAMNLFLFATKPAQYQRAGVLFGRAAGLPGAPTNPNVAKFMEARCFDVGQRRDLAINVWKKTYMSPSSDEERQVAARTLKKLRVPLPTLQR